ncbi:MAG: relaxase [Sphingobacteriales bacterium]|nr:MAG: relaxase [Sphingobacteriales bacterium]
MVAVISTGHSVRRILNYNENKVREGCAQCIGEGNYPTAVEDMDFTMKLNRLVRQNALNANVKRNSVHISLNFDPSEQYPAEKLMEIARNYMEKTGFGQQPYLVYEHHDAGHPHIHLISVKVRSDGSRIDMQNMGRNQSEKARKEIEQVFGLVKAQGRNTKSGAVLQPVAAGRAEYGKTQSKKALAGVLQYIIPAYQYTSLAQLNAVLGLYNVKADRGNTGSRIFQSGGLVYRILDSNGKPVGVSIKASDFPMKPTLAFLENKFKANERVSLFEKKKIRNAVDLAFIKSRPSLERLAALLKKDGIDMVVRKGEKDIIYGITYVDHNTRCVYNGSELGKNYSAKTLLERCMQTGRRVQETIPGTGFKNSTGAQADTGTCTVSQSDGVPLWDMLSKPEWQPDFLPRGLKGKRRKKKRRGQKGEG